ncbi:MAG TPA: maleylacetoacetate isomerase, partial [Candidatus Sulfotelmatobacter sp.]|nr:maleylacetoacetate isomerase [Candidatus Sulfotelmatobacter sp.]
MMKLYGFFRSSAAFRVRIALNLKGLDYEPSAVHLRRGEQRAPEFLKLNPQALVPALIDGERVLTQSLAIIEYLDEVHPARPLLPATPEGRARVRALAQIIACEIHPLGNLRVLQYLGRELKQDEPTVQRWFNHWIALGFQAFESLIAGHAATGTFCHGDEPGLADVCLVPQVFNARRYDLDLKPYPTLMRIFDACMAL